MARASGRSIAPAVLLLTVWSSACAPPLIKLPTGNGVRATDAAEALRDATAACRAVSNITAEIGVSGSVAGHRLRARLLAGLAAPASARLEAVAPFGQPVFIFVASNDDATLLLPRDRRVLEHGRPAAVLEAVAGAPLDAADLRIALTGCTAAPRPHDATKIGYEWRVVPDGSGDVYLRRDSVSAPWRIVAAVHRGGATSWQAEYRDFQTGGPTVGLPASVRLTSRDRQQFDLRLALSQVEVNIPLDAGAFQVQTPPGTERISLEELRRSGPLSSSSGGG